MNKNLEVFIEKLINDTALAEKLSACKSDDEAYAIAHAVQDGFTEEEFAETMKAIYQASTNGDLTREDLAGVAGGVEVDTTLTTMTVGLAFGAAI